MSRWAQAGMDRHQQVLFSPTLDAAIPEDHPVRLFEELLAAQDWSAWEGQYVQVKGQPPIHPRVLAGAILYGLSQGIRSSRRLEWACANALDFLWLVEGRTIDHSTFCGFRTRFAPPLKDLFRQTGRLAMHMGMIRLGQLGLDGTALRASSSRHGTRKLQDLQEELAKLDAQIERMFAEADAADRRETDLLGQEVSPNHLPKELKDVKARQAKLKAAVQAAQARGAEGSTRVGMADPEATVGPNKEGGMAPNYTPMTAVDGQAGLIVGATVLDRTDEGGQTVAMVDEVAKAFGQMPQQVLADSKHGSGQNLKDLQDRGVEAFIPQEQRQDRPDNPARRDDPSVPVASERLEKLPRNHRTKKFDRSAFLYEGAQDCYYCPQGRKLPFKSTTTDRGAGTVRHYRLYECPSCAGCPWASHCLAGQGSQRTVSRDENEPLREAMDRKLRTAEGWKTYARRKWIAETPFAGIKAVMGARRFLLRGLAKVRTEWLWCCTGYNLMKMVRHVAALRQRWVQMAT
jgi:transposase